MTSVDLTKKECEVYIMLREARAFDVKGGQVIIHFDGEGDPRMVEVTTRTLSTPVRAHQKDMV